MERRMRRTFYLLSILTLMIFSGVFGAAAQTPGRIEVDGSFLSEGDSFQFTITVDSDELLSFANAEARLTAVLCPVEMESEQCQVLNMAPSAEDSASMQVVFSAEALPAAGDYTLDVSFTDISGEFAQQSASYLITGVQPSVEMLIQPSAEATAIPAETTAPTEIPVEETAAPTETPAPAETPQTAPEAPDYDPDQPTVTISVTLSPTMRDEAGNNLVYGSTLYVGEDYYLQIVSDVPMNDSVTVEVGLPATLLAAPLDPDSECFSFLNADGTALSIPGSRWNEQNRSAFRCKLSFTDSAFLAANPMNITVRTTSLPANETYEAAPLSWNYYPVNIAKYAATHQIQISDSRGNLICSDMVPCSAFNADDFYTLTYKFPADWSEALPTGRQFSADMTWPEAWKTGLQQSLESEAVSLMGTACAVGPDGTTHLELTETAPGRYTASCVIVPDSISNPVQDSAVMHLNDNSFNVSDLKLTLPGLIVKQQAIMTPSLTVRMNEGSAEDEQIRSGNLGSLYRTTVDMPNNGNGFGTPALYTLKAQVEGVSPARSPLAGDHVRVTWSVLDALYRTGDLPSCLTPDGNGFALGALTRTDDGIWQAECSFRFPLSMPVNTYGGSLQMELFSGMYSTTTVTGVASMPFEKKTLAVNLDIPNQMVPNHPIEMKASLSDESGGLNDYTRAVLEQTGLELYSDWAYNYASTCQGYYDLSGDGIDSCTVQFDAPVSSSSTMLFRVESPELAELFNVEFRPAAAVYVAGVSRMDVNLTPSLTLRMTQDAAESEQINGGWLGTMYRTASDMPNLYMSSDAPARYTLRANISGIFADSVPNSEDQVIVSWNMLDFLAQSGNLPACLAPVNGGYQLGTLEQNEDGGWSASCEFFFPSTLNENLAAGSLSMRLVSPAYQAVSYVQMSGYPFKHGNLYVDLDIPEHMLVRQMTEFRVRVSDENGHLSDYARAILDAGGASLRSDWAYNYVTTCQGLYELDADGNSSCSALFDTPTSGDSQMHFELLSPGIENLFNVSYRPSADILIPEISNPTAELSVKLFHAGTEMSLPASDGDVFHVGEAYQLQFYLTPDPEYRDVLNAVAVDNEGYVMDWYDPLRIHWGMIPGGDTAMNFYRDGDRFVARYDFSFDQGDVMLFDNLGQLVVECWIENWDIRGVNDMVPIQLPSRVDRKPVSLEISDFTVDLFGNPGRDVYADQNAEFDVRFSGDLNYFDSNLLTVGYDANGIRTPVDCFPDYENGTLHCSFIPQCTDYSYMEYPAVCGTNLSLYAEYAGDNFNESAAADPKTFNVKRADLHFTSAVEGSLSQWDLAHISGASDDLMSYVESSVRAGGWPMDSYLPKSLRSMDGIEDKIYPVIFNYTVTGNIPLDESLLRLDVHFRTGSYQQPVDDVISLKSRMFTDDMVMFELDFGSFEMLDDGRTLRDALADAVEITALTVRYPGSPLVAPSSADYEAENLNFALKLVTQLDMDLNITMPGVLRFDGAAAAELVTKSFDVYCAQLYREIQCSVEQPLDVLNEEGEPILSEVVPDGCWGRVQTVVGQPLVYVNHSVYPQCYLVTLDAQNGIMLAGEFN